MWKVAAWSKHSSCLVFRSVRVRSTLVSRSGAFVFCVQKPFCSVFSKDFVSCLGARVFHIQEPRYFMFRSTRFLFRSPFVQCSGTLLFRVQQHACFKYRCLVISCSGALVFLVQKPFCSVFKSLLFSVQEHAPTVFVSITLISTWRQAFSCCSSLVAGYLSYCVLIHVIKIPFFFPQFITHNRTVSHSTPCDAWNWERVNSTE